MKKVFCQPLKQFIITQAFGEDRACISADNKKVISKPQGAVCPDGFRSLYGNMNGHNGIDLFATRWQPVYGAREGKVIEVSTEAERGLGVGILSVLDGVYYKHRYWHLIALDVSLGEEVKTGDLIGYADSTGYSSGDHLHFEVKVVNANGEPTEPNNGYFGAVDPLPLVDNIFALDAKGIESTIAKVREQLALLADALADFLRWR